MHLTGITKGWVPCAPTVLRSALPRGTAVVVAFKQSWQALGLRLER